MKDKVYYDGYGNSSEDTTNVSEGFKIGLNQGKLQAKKDELIFLMNMKIALFILGDKEKEGMEDGQIMVLRRIKQLQKEVKEK